MRAQGAWAAARADRASRRVQLSAARAVGPRKTPVVGIHLGELGFLAEVTVEEMFNRLNQIINGDFLVNNRMVLKATLSKNDSEKTFFALNDFVVDRGRSQRIIDLDFFRQLD